jgi:predicted SAM-dependent methyltransferase
MRNPHSVTDAVRSIQDGVAYARTQYWRVRHNRSLNEQRDKAFASYQNQSPRGLHLGAANFVINGWFNTDLQPFVPGVYYLDATRPLPFPNRSFNFIFFEHMIEHIPFAAGRQLLGECHRVLAPAGVVRIATPNLRNILALISNRDAATESYLDWAAKTFNLEQGAFPKAPIVVNNFFRSWGHQFLYDPETIRRAMEEAGFVEIVEQKVGVSAHIHLQGLERHGQAIGESINEFETMVFEGTAG